MSDVNSYYAAIADSSGAFFLLDVVSSESHSFEADITEFPVESGGDITDNVRSLPIEVSMDIVVSDTPLATIARVRQQASATRQSLSDASNFGVLQAAANGNLAPPQNPNTPSEDLLAHLLAIRDARLPVSIITSLRRYDSMVLKRVSVPRDASSGTGQLRCTCEFKEIRIVDNKRYTKVSVPRAMGSKTRNTTPKPVALDQNYNDSLPLFKIVRVEGSYVWYDASTLQGWRYGVVHDAPGVTDGAPQIGTPYSAAKEGWVFYKDRPYGVLQSDWLRNRKTDAAYRDDIQNAAAASAGPDGFGDGFNHSKYDPRGGSEATDITTVHGRLVSQPQPPIHKTSIGTITHE